jgi:hypothetical protein
MRQALAKFSYKMDVKSFVQNLDARSAPLRKRDSRDQLATIPTLSTTTTTFLKHLCIVTIIMPTSKALHLQPPSILLKYTIASSSPHSGKYAPENIIEDKPMDQASRWSGAFQASTNQWIILELESLSVLSNISIFLLHSLLTLHIS